MTRHLLLSAALVFAWGCSPDPDIIYPDDLPGNNDVASPQLLTPSQEGQLITTWSSSDREVVLKHKGTKNWSGQETVVQNASGIPVLGKGTDVLGPDNDGVYGYFTASATIQYDWEPAVDGRYKITVSYYTLSPYITETNEGITGLAKRTKSLNFKVCAPGNSSCTYSLAGDPEPSRPNQVPAPCEFEIDEDCGGGGGGGGGGTTRPYALRRIPLTEANQPYFVLAGAGSSISRGEVEDYLGSLNNDQLDFVAAIVSEVYDEDLYDLASVTVSPGSTFPQLMADLDPYLSTASFRGTDFLSALLAKYEDATRSERSRSGPATGRVTVAPGDESSGLSLSAWPNPTAERLTVEYAGPARPTHVLVYDAVGREIAALRATNAGGGLRAEWDLRTSGGDRVSPGFYQVVVRSDEGAVSSRSVTVL